jgi:dipeptidyl aminopeptidase/acylaminoacyl peptidase
MKQDIRESPLYREAEALYETLRRPGTGQISDAAEIHVSPDGAQAAFTATLVARLEGALQTRIAVTDLRTGQTQLLTFGPNTDRLPKYSPDGSSVAFLSDRHKAGDFQLYLLDRESDAVRSTPNVSGWVEYIHWSPDGTKILLGVAGHGADIAGVQGAVASQPLNQDMPSWIPEVDTGDESYRWRHAWVYELKADHVRPVSFPDLNVWEAVWCGNETVAAVASPGPGEGLWYSARLYQMNLASGVCREMYTPEDQLGCLSASPSGDRVAIVKALCSDRGSVAGDVCLFDVASGQMQAVYTRGVDVTCTEWRSDQHLLLAGHRGFHAVVGLYDTVQGQFTEVWGSQDLSSGADFIAVAGCGEPGDCVLVGESFVRAPEIAVIRAGAYRTVKSLDLGYSDAAKVIDSVQLINWDAPDGLDMQGWLLTPRGERPHPVIAYIHGGPVWHWHPFWLGRPRNVFVLMLLKRGYAVFLPNPRGSTARGQDFARRVRGDMGGADTYDVLSGLDHLVEQGVADRERLGVIGTSYGGFMSSWLITQDARFVAAVAVAPIANQVTEHLMSNLPHFVSMFLADTYTNPTGRYFERSPIMHTHKARTPTLVVCGRLDRCTPAAEAIQLHSSLLERNVKSVLITYPQEGHGIHKWPACIDYAARVVDWFEQHVSAALDP